LFTDVTGKISVAQINKPYDIIVVIKNKIAYSALPFFLFSVAAILEVELYCTGFKSHLDCCVKVFTILSDPSL